MGAVAEPLNRRVFDSTLEFLSKMEKKYYRNGKTSIKILDLDSREQAVNFPIQWFSPFYEKFNEKIQALIEAGICPHRLAGKVVPKTELTGRRYDEEMPPLVLSMDDLGVGFEVCLIPLALSVLVFNFELKLSETT